MKYLAAGWRFVVMMIFVVLCLATAYLVFPHVRRDRQLWLMHWYSKKIIEGAGVHISIDRSANSAPRGAKGLTVVSNHVSWLDIFAINVAFPSKFIAKAEIAQWPIFGLIARQIGTLFVNRGKKSAIIQLNKDIAESLEQGNDVALFAEGTTTFGNELLPIKSNFLAPAVAVDGAVQPIILSYTSGGKPTKQMAFAGDRTLFGTLWLILTTPEAGVTVYALPEIKTTGLNRREVGELCQEEMRKKLQEIWGSEFKTSDPDAARKLQEAIKNG